MSKTETIVAFAALLEQARKLGPMTDKQCREQAASFAFGNLALTREWQSKTSLELEELRRVCRKQAGCIDEGAEG